MDNGHHVHFNAQERSYLAILKKDVHALAAEAGFSGKKLADVDIVVAEITSNLVKHAKQGELLVRVDAAGVELISIDHGPGIADVRRMSEDGISTTNTLGQGLGAIKRLSDECDMYSLRGWGTIVVSRIFKVDKPHYTPPAAAEIRSIVVAKPGETACGDGVHVILSADRLKILAGDGLGHGPDAQVAVSAAERAFAAESQASPVALLRSVHTGVKRTRGLVCAVAIYDFKEQTWRICGVGNIAAWIGNQQAGKGVMSYNGIVGVNVPTSLNEHIIAHEYGQILVMASDGIRTRWDLQKYPGILKHDLTILAAAIYKDFARKTDDMSVLIARINGKP